MLDAPKTKTTASFNSMIKRLLIVSWIILLTGCKTYTVIPADKEVQPIAAGQSFVAPVSGWFVPDSRMLDILNKLEGCK